MTNELESNKPRNTIVRLLNWSQEDIDKLDDINVNWMMLEDYE